MDMDSIFSCKNENCIKMTIPPPRRYIRGTQNTKQKSFALKCRSTRAFQNMKTQQTRQALKEFRDYTCNIKKRNRPLTVRWSQASIQRFTPHIAAAYLRTSVHTKHAGYMGHSPKTMKHPRRVQTRMCRTCWHRMDCRYMHICLDLSGHLLDAGRAPA